MMGWDVRARREGITVLFGDGVRRTSDSRGPWQPCIPQKALILTKEFQSSPPWRNQPVPFSSYMDAAVWFVGTMHSTR